MSRREDHAMTSRIRVVGALLISGALFVVACGQSETSQTAPRQEAPAQTIEANRIDDAGSESTACPFPLAFNTNPSSSCPSGCVAVMGEEADPDHACKRFELAGCIPCSRGCGGAPEGSCLKRLSDGRILDGLPSYVLSNLPDASDWVSCTQAEESAQANLSVCN